MKVLETYKKEGEDSCCWTNKELEVERALAKGKNMLGPFDSEIVKWYVEQR